MKNTLTSLGIVISMFVLLSCGSNNSSTNYQVAISASPEEGGTVSPTSGQHEEGTSLDIIATPSEDWKFVRWEGDYKGTNDSTTITVDTAKSITAVFDKKKYPLTIDIEGEGTVDEQVVLTNSTKDYKHGTIVELKATPAQGWEFVEWKKAVTGSDNPTQITVEEAKEVIAVFKKKSFALTVNTIGEGLVIKSPNQTEYKYNAKVDLAAEPAKGREFVKWKGDISLTDNPAKIVINESKSVTAIFQKKKFSVTISTQGNGKINISPEKEMYEFNDEVEFEASSGDGFEFIKWNGSLSGNRNPQTITISKNISAEAIFKKPVEALASDFHASVLIGGRVHQASLSLTNELASKILLKKIIIKDGDGKTTTSKDIGEKIENGKSLGFSISYGIPPTEDDFKKLTVLWLCEYNGKAIEKKGKATLPSLPFGLNSDKPKKIIRLKSGEID